MIKAEKMVKLFDLLFEMYDDNEDLDIWVQENDEDETEVSIGVELPVYDNGQKGTGEKIGSLTVWFTPNGIMMYDPTGEGDWELVSVAE